ncbi:MAG: hypothetical protein RI885_2022, partial [Actinomycetota bacterium]
ARGPVPVEGAAVGIGGAFGAAQGAAPDAIDGAGTAGRSPGTLDREAVGAAFRDETGFVQVATASTPVSIFTPRRPTKVYTFAVWLLAILPLPGALGMRGLTGMVPADDLWTVRIAALGTLTVISLICAVRDTQVLRSARHSETASAGWMLLTPLAYLIARTGMVRLETGVRASAPLLVWLVCVTGAVVLLAGAAIGRVLFAAI